MRRLLRRLGIDLDVDRRADYLRTRGSQAFVRAGPIRLAVSTADGWAVGCFLLLGRRAFGWTADSSGADGFDA